MKPKNNQNCQKIKLYGSPITKELKKKDLSRLVGKVEMGSQGGEDLQQGRELGWRGGTWQTRQFHIHLWISWEEQLGSETDHATQSSNMGK